MSEFYRKPACPLHFGIGYSLECLDCRAMPTIMPDGQLRDSYYGATTDHLRRWAMAEKERGERTVKGGERDG